MEPHLALAIDNRRGTLADLVQGFVTGLGLGNDFCLTAGIVRLDPDNNVVGLLDVDCLILAGMDCSAVLNQREPGVRI